MIQKCVNGRKKRVRQDSTNLWRNFLKCSAQKLLFGKESILERTHDRAWAASPRLEKISIGVTKRKEGDSSKVKFTSGKLLRRNESHAWKNVKPVRCETINQSDKLVSGCRTRGYVAIMRMIAADATRVSDSCFMSMIDLVLIFYQKWFARHPGWSDMDPESHSDIKLRRHFLFFFLFHCIPQARVATYHFYMIITEDDSEEFFRLSHCR